MENQKPKNKGEHIRGSDLKLTERDIISALPLFKRISAFLFGGVFGMRDPSPPQHQTVPRMVIVYIPPVWKRFYYKHMYPKSKHRPNPLMNGVEQDEQK